MPKTLILITAGFPFGSKEPFLETEIEYLEKKFERIIVLPRTKTGEPRAVSNRVEIQDLFFKKENASPNFARRLKIGASLLTSKFFWQEVRNVLTNPHIPFKIKNLQLAWSIGQRVVKNFFLLKNFLKTENLASQPAIFYSYWLTTDAVAIGLLKRENPQIFTLARAHRFDLYEFPRPTKFLPFRRLAAKTLDAICPISADGLDYLKSQFAAPAERLHLMRLGSRQLKNQPEIPATAEPFVFLSIARFRPVKRVELIAKAILELAKRHPNRQFHWQHFGGGEQNLIEKTEHIAANFPKNVSVELAGEIPNSQILNYLRSNRAHLFVNLSSSEGLPVSMMEAQSVGIPIMATDVGGVREIVSNRTGCLLAADAPLDLILSEIEKFFDDEFRVAKAKSAFENWFENFDAHKNYSKFSKWLTTQV